MGEFVSFESIEMIEIIYATEKKSISYFSRKMSNNLICPKFDYLLDLTLGNPLGSISLLEIALVIYYGVFLHISMRVSFETELSNFLHLVHFTIITIITSKILHREEKVRKQPESHASHILLVNLNDRNILCQPEYFSYRILVN